MTDETPARAGTGADLSRRVERLEGQMSTLSTAVDRVELKQQFAAELMAEKFKGIDNAVANQTELLASFIKRMESLISGETKLPNQEAQLADWQRFRQKTEDRLTIVEAVPTLLERVGTLEVSAQRRGGVMDALQGAKGVVLMIAAIVSPLIAAIGIIVTRP